MVFQLHYVQLVSLVGFMNALWTNLDDHVVFIAFGNCSWSHAEVEMYKSNQNHASMKTKNRETRMCPENLKPIFVLMCFLGTSGLPATRIHQLLDRKHSTCDRMKTKKKPITFEIGTVRCRYCNCTIFGGKYRSSMCQRVSTICFVIPRNIDSFALALHCINSKQSFLLF